MSRASDHSAQRRNGVVIPPAVASRKRRPTTKRGPVRRKDAHLGNSLTPSEGWAAQPAACATCCCRRGHHKRLWLRWPSREMRSRPPTQAIVGIPHRFQHVFGQRLLAAQLDDLVDARGLHQVEIGTGGDDKTISELITARPQVEVIELVFVGSLGGIVVTPISIEPSSSFSPTSASAAEIATVAASMLSQLESKARHPHRTAVAAPDRTFRRSSREASAPSKYSAG